MPSKNNFAIVLPIQLREEIKQLEARIAELRSELRIYGDLKQAISDKHGIMEEITNLAVRSAELKSDIEAQNDAHATEETKRRESWKIFEDKAKASMREHSERVETKLQTMRAELDKREEEIERSRLELDSEMRAMEDGRMKLMRDQENLQRKESQYALSVVAVQERERRATAVEEKLAQGFTDVANRAKTLGAERDIFKMEVDEFNERRRVAGLESQQYAVKKAEAEHRMREAADAEGKARSLRVAVEQERESLKSVQERLSKEQSEHGLMRATLKEELERQTRVGAELIQREARVKTLERQVELAKEEAKTLYNRAFEASAKNLRGEVVT